MPPGQRRTDARGITPAFHDHLAATVCEALAEHEGDVLVFVPGAAEVEASVRRLAGAASAQGVAVYPLHGRLSGTEQDRALTEGPGRRVVGSPAVAESCLSVPGVRIEVAGGLDRKSTRAHSRHKRAA